MKHFTPSEEPAEGLGVLLLFRLIEEAMPSFFETGRPIQIARAPGRLDIMGGLGGHKAPLSLSLPTSEAACAAIQARPDDLIRLWSPCRDDSRTQMLSVRIGDLGLPATPIAYDEARAFLVADPKDRWAGYILGSLLVLAREHALTPDHGAEVLLYSDVPNWCGVASSTAVTVAALRAFALQYGLDLPATEFARLAQIVEREVLRANGRVADAMTSVMAESGELLILRGAAGDVVDRVKVPADLEFVALETGTKTDAKDDGFQVPETSSHPGCQCATRQTQESGDSQYLTNANFLHACPQTKLLEENLGGTLTNFVDEQSYHCHNREASVWSIAYAQAFRNTSE